MSKVAHQIKTVAKNSPAERAGLITGDILRQLNGVELVDIFDYYYYSDEPELDVLLEHSDGSFDTVHISKEEGEDLGVTFENGLMDDYKSCHNKCIFCFIDQMPKGMRDTLYFKDDDTRLSFLQGNYVTLTNMSYEDLDRIIHYHLAPINISVQSTEPKLRCEMLHNRFAGDIMEKIKKLGDAGIEMNAQIVLCKGINDGEHLRRSIEDLYTFYPYMHTLSVVPVGLSKYREGLYPLEPFEKADACSVIDMIEQFQDKVYAANGEHFVYASDEWYLTAERDIPDAERYDEYGQLENGVGMIRLLLDEFREALSLERPHLFMRKREISIATGILAAPFIQTLMEETMAKFPKLTIHVYPIRNDFFGERITVSGLVVGADLIAQLKGKPLGEKLLLPHNMVRQEEQDFLDDVTVAEVSQTLQVPVDIVKSSGREFLFSILHS